MALGLPVATVVFLAVMIGPMHVAGRIGERLYAGRTFSRGVGGSDVFLVPMAIFALTGFSTNESAVAAFALFAGIATGLSRLFATPFRRYCLDSKRTNCKDPTRHPFWLLRERLEMAVSLFIVSFTISPNLTGPASLVTALWVAAPTLSRPRLLMIRKGQMGMPGAGTMSVADQFYALTGVVRTA
jgi:hypothetical protein